MRIVKHRKSLATRVIVIFLICNLISIVLFSYIISIREKNYAVENTKSNLQEIVKEKSQLISISFQRVENSTVLLGSIYGKLLKNDSNIDNRLKSDYVINKNGTIKRKKNKDKKDVEQSGIYVARTTKKTPALFKEINTTEQLDDTFAEILDREDVTWAYIVTKNNLLRCSPYSELTRYFTENHNQKYDPFYVDANEKNDPNKKAVWTKPYTDYLGTGWMMTCSQPVYDENNIFRGVACLDLSINIIKDKYLKGFTLGKTGKIYWLTRSGNIYYQSDMETKAKTQGEIFEKNIFKEEKMTDAKTKILKEALKGGSGMKSYIENGEEKVIIYAPVKEAKSVLIIDMDESQFNSTTKFDPVNVTLLILIDLLIAGIFLLWMNYKFRRPMTSLVEQANRISKGDYSTINEELGNSNNVYEVARLQQAFSTMNASIEKYTDDLLEKNKEISTILDTVDGTLMIVSIDGKILVISKETKGINDEIIGKALDRIKQDGDFFSEQIVIEKEVYRNTYYPIKNKAGTVEKMVISSECITKSLLMEKEVQQIEKMAGIGQLSAAIVHELKNSLALVKGATYILQKTDTNEDNLKEIVTISKAADDAQDVIDTLLDYSKGETNGREMIHIGTLIKQILLLSKKEIISKNILTELSLDNNCYVRSTSREALKVILQNIIINAVQAVDEDGIIEIKCCKKDDKALISIRDNGPAIPDDVKANLFEPFYSTKENGNGIGLWISKRITDSLGGKLDVKEDDDHWTEFDIELPG